MTRPLRGLRGQYARRAAERDARRRAAAQAAELRATGLTTTDAAALLGRSPRTFRRWKTLKPHVTRALGRRAKRAPTPVRDAALRDLRARPRLSARLLCQRHPSLGLREAKELKARYGSHYTAARRDTVHVLTWTTPGSVWAVDFSDAGVEVEGGFDQLLLVRDLATGLTLLALPCLGQDAATVRAAFAALFARHGPPLVLKSDNGSAFVSELLAELLAAHQVILLRSPPGTPAFNGACEAGGGSIKTRAHHIAAASGREACWSLDDVAAARTSANETPSSADPTSTPAHRWRERSALEPGRRSALAAEVVARTIEDLALRGLHPVHRFEDHLAQDVARTAIAGALRACSLLSSHLTTIPARRGPRRSDKGMSEEVSSSR